MAPVILEHPSSLAHDTGSHPERAERMRAIAAELDRHDWLGLPRMQSQPASRELLTAVHPAAHIDAIESLCARGGGFIDADTLVSEHSFRAASHAAGGAAQLVAMLCAGEAQWGMSLHRPPGHHATRDRAMGFCLFNSVAVAAQHAIDACGVGRVLIFDWDVHHGNGTNDIFHGSDQVLFASIHQSPLYPGTGPSSDVGSGAGAGYTVNLPVAPGSGDPEFLSLLAHVVAPLARSFAPDLLLVSAGYDAHRDDPLADCAVTDSGYAQMASAMQALAGELEVPLGVVLEGGYALDALARSVLATLQALKDPAPVHEVPEAPVAQAARLRLAQFWPDLDP